MDYRQALGYVYSFTNFEVTPAGDYTSKTFDLTRMEQLLAALGRPQNRFRSIHIAGTKGKGSTAAILESVLRAAGYRTGFFSSPHLHTFRERIRLNGEMISKDELVAGVNKLKPIVDRLAGVTTFEIMTALAFDRFAAHGTEIAVLEVGLGGRLDATNVVTPLVSVITSISYDHTAILGYTLPEIAREKAGIVKTGVPVVTSAHETTALQAISKIADSKSAPLVVVRPDLTFQIGPSSYRSVPLASSPDIQRFAWIRTSADGHSSELALDLPLLGHHQLVNGTTALAAMRVISDRGVPIADDAIRTGFARVDWPGRFEILDRNPFLVVDGAHNADSALQLAHTLGERFPGAAVHLVFGASGDKDLHGMFAELLPHVRSLILTRSHNPRAADPVRLREMAREYSIDISIEPDLATAVQAARRQALPTDVICVTGSLFVVAEARQAWFEEHGRPLQKD